MPEQPAPPDPLNLATVTELEEAFERAAQNLCGQMNSRIDADSSGEALKAAQDLDKGLQTVKAALKDLREALRWVNQRLGLSRYMVEDTAEVKG